MNAESNTLNNEERLDSCMNMSKDEDFEVDQLEQSSLTIKGDEIYMACKDYLFCEVDIKSEMEDGEVNNCEDGFIRLCEGDQNGSSSIEGMSELDCSSLLNPWPHIGSVFNFVGAKVGNHSHLTFDCLLCRPQKTFISANSKSMFDLRIHIQRKHPNKLTYFNEIASYSKKRKSRSTPVNSSKCSKMDTPTKIGNRSLTSQEDFDDHVLNYVINGMVSLAQIEAPAFKNFISLLKPDFSIISSERIKLLLAHKRDVLYHKIKDILKDVEWMATSLDCWTYHGSSFIGISAHWIDSDQLERRNVVLGCRRLKEKYVYEIMKSVLDIYTEYNIKSKVITSTVDSELISYKPFPVFTVDGLNKQRIFQEDLTQVLKHEKQLDKTMHVYKRCAAHTLNLIAVEGTKTAENHLEFKRRSYDAFSFCQTFWKKLSLSPYIDNIEKESSIQMTPPEMDRWSSIFHSIQKLNQLIQKVGDCSFQKICSLVGISGISLQDKEFLQCYEKTMKPVSTALNILKKHSSVYSSYLLPTLVALQVKLKEHLDSETAILNPCFPLVKALLKSIEERFSYAFESETYIAAAILHPKFKDSWITGDEELSKGIVYINGRLQEMSGIEREASVSPESPVKNDTDSGSDNDFGSFFVAVKKRDFNEYELQNYLNTKFDGNLKEFYNQFPKLKKLFSEICTPVPCSYSVVSHLFSGNKAIAGTQFLCSYDENSESTLLLNANSQYC